MTTKSRSARATCCWSSMSRTTSARAAGWRCRAAMRSCHCINRAGPPFQARGADAGLASGRPPVVRVHASGQAAVRDDRGRLRAADPVAGPLRAGHARRAFRDDLRIPHAALVLRKGFRPTIDSYSAFYENDRKTPTGLAGYLARTRASRGCSSPASRSIFACAIRPRMRAAKGFDVVVIDDACRGIDVDGSVAATRRSFAALDITAVTENAFG